MNTLQLKGAWKIVQGGLVRKPYKITTIAAALMLAATMAKATDAKLFSANELSLDLSGSYIAGERGVEHLFETSIKDSRGTWGGDVGLNYFITRNIGVGADANMPANGGNLVDSVFGNLILRVPIGNSGIAPYLIGGGGRMTDPTWEWAGEGGVGLEVRFSHSIGLFTDARYVWPQHTSDGLLVRAGLRIAF